MSVPADTPKKHSSDAVKAKAKPTAQNWRKIAKALHLETQALQQQFDALKAENKVNLFACVRKVGLHLQTCCGV